MELLSDSRNYAVSQQPSTGQYRITMTGPLILNGAPLLVPILGTNKEPVIQRLSKGYSPSNDTPAAYILSHAVQATIYGLNPWFCYMPSPSKKHVRVFEKTRTTFRKNTYDFWEKHVHVFGILWSCSYDLICSEIRYYTFCLESSVYIYSSPWRRYTASTLGDILHRPSKYYFSWYPISIYKTVALI